MVWTATADRATGYLVPASLWNEMLGASGNLEELRVHTHDGTDGDGSASLGPLVLEDFTDAAAPAAPGAGKTRLSATSGRLQQRAGAAGATQVLAKNPMTTAGDIVYGGASGDETRLAIAGAAGLFLKANAGETAPEWAAPSVAHGDLTGVTASQHHPRTEAKVTPGAVGAESVTWTTAFSATPVVVATMASTGGSDDDWVQVTARSTTGATVSNHGTVNSVVKTIIAQEAT